MRSTFFEPGGKLKQNEVKKLSSTRQCLKKKRQKVRIEMQGGRERAVGGPPVASCIVQRDGQEGTFFLVSKPKKKSNKQMSVGKD